jgi:hypothetical protein
MTPPRYCLLIVEGRRIGASQLSEEPKVKKFVFVAACIACVALTSVASAETLYIAGISGIQDPNVPCGEQYVPAAEMHQPTFDACTYAYPLNLPAGKTLDTIEIAYANSGGPPNASITAYLGQNRVKPYQGAIAIAGASAAPPKGTGVGYLTMPALNIPISSGSVYWVQIVNKDIYIIESIAVTYH